MCFLRACVFVFAFVKKLESEAAHLEMRLYIGNNGRGDEHSCNRLRKE